MKKSVLAFAAIAVLTAACGDGTTPGSPTTVSPATTAAPPTTPAPPTTSVPDTTLPPLPTDPEQRILVVHRGGGLVPPEFLLDRLPLYTLYADGRLVYEGATPAIFPGPLMPALVQVDIGEKGLAEVLTAVAATGLPDFAELRNNDAINRVTDGPQTEVNYYDDNGRHLFSVYALEIAEHKDPAVLALADLMDLLDRLTATSPDAGPFEVERLQVIASSQTANPDHPDAVVEPWPLVTPPEQIDEFEMALRCGAFDVATEQSALEAFRAAHQLTFFESDEVVYRLTVRPLLPGEPGCEPWGS